MDDALNDLKKRLRAEYLGKAGIHGFGLRRASDAVCVYLKEDRSQEQAALLREIQQVAAPHQVVIVAEEMPRAA